MMALVFRNIVTLLGQMTSVRVARPFWSFVFNDQIQYAYVTVSLHFGAE